MAQLVDVTDRMARCLPSSRTKAQSLLLKVRSSPKHSQVWLCDGIIGCELAQRYGEILCDHTTEYRAVKVLPSGMVFSGCATTQALCATG